MELEDYQTQRKVDIGTGMVVGAIIGVGVAALMGSKYRDEVAGTAKQKFDELMKSSNADEVGKAARKGIGRILDDIANAQRSLPKGK